MANTPSYAATPRNASAVVSVANPNRDGSLAGTFANICTAGTNGTRIDYISVTALSQTQAGMVRLWVHDTVNGARLWKEIEVSAVTPTGTVKSFHAEMVLSYPLLLQAGQSLRGTTHNTNDFVVVAMGGDL